MTREITHMKAFTAALESLGKPVFSIGRIPPTPSLVNQYFNDSTGIGDRGEPEDDREEKQGAAQVHPSDAREPTGRERGSRQSDARPGRSGRSKACPGEADTRMRGQKQRC